MRRTDRLFELVQLFRGGRLWRGRDLAERLETSLRTVYRDIDTLVASGIPIEGERGLGYILREPIFLPPLTLSQPELDALHLGVALVARMGDTAPGEAAARLIEKIDAVLPNGRRGIEHAVGIAIHTPTPPGQHDHIPILRDAIEARRIIDMGYRKLDETRAQRTVRPLHLEFLGAGMDAHRLVRAANRFPCVPCEQDRMPQGDRSWLPPQARQVVQRLSFAP